MSFCSGSTCPQTSHTCCDEAQNKFKAKSVHENFRTKDFFYIVGERFLKIVVFIFHNFH